MNDLAGLSQVEYIEKPKRLYFEVNRAIRDACIAPVQSGNQVSQNVYGRDADLSGRGTLTAIIDSGIDYFPSGLSKRRWNDAHRRTLGSGAEPDLYAGGAQPGIGGGQRERCLRDRPVAGCERARDGSCGDCSRKAGRAADTTGE